VWFLVHRRDVIALAPGAMAGGAAAAAQEKSPPLPTARKRGSSGGTGSPEA
jgi:hypothetical protein